jgi:type I restriction enzyme, S subunit
MDIIGPKIWPLRKIGDLGRCITGTTPKTEVKEYYTNPDYDFIAPADLGSTKYIYDSNKKISEAGFKVVRPLPKDSVLCVCIGSSIGKVGLSHKEESCTNQQINSVVCGAGFDPHFVYYLLSYYSSYWKSFATFGPVPILNKSRFEGIELPVPSGINEQRRIARVLSTVQAAM